MTNRELVMKFWSFPLSVRYKIVNDLGLLEDGDIKRTEVQRYELAFQHARERNLTDKLFSAIEKEPM